MLALVAQSAWALVMGDRQREAVEEAQPGITR